MGLAPKGATKTEAEDKNEAKLSRKTKKAAKQKIYKQNKQSRDKIKNDELV